ncbi:S8 family serine peptidase [Kribbella ginsengisoli]|uniref:Peptidase S8/S53 domain-containing protein n=1 Tax=Kribbella ginsengisoli TaxID=363865 RepID=A0ABP6YQ40_9ACTN
MSLSERGFPQSFDHPAAGESTLVAELLAIRWRDGAERAGKEELLAATGFEQATIGEAGRPVLAVNQTDGLWWVRRGDESAVDEEQLDQLGSSPLVEWVAPAYRSAGAARAADETATVGAVFTVNPTRLYVRQQVFDAARTAGTPDLAPDPQRRSRLPEYAAMRVTDGTALSVAARLADAPEARGVAGAAVVRFETVPFISPTCSVSPAATRGNCRPPAGEFVPNDPQFGTQWGLQRMEVPRAWQIVRGSSDVVVAVIDQGVELGHPDLLLYPQSWNASSDTPDGSPTGDHGTACAGIVAARLDNSEGVAGVAGGCQVMAIATSTWADVDIAEGLYFAADNGAKVVSMSFGVYESWGVWDFDLIRDALQYAHDQGLLLVAASGNEDGNIARFPGSDSRTLCVGGSNRSDERKRTGDSSAEDFWGASYGPDLDVVAPCLEIPTTDRLGGDGYDAGDYFGFFNGTSSATPAVAGLGALVFSLRPQLSNAAVRSMIESTCDKISPALYSYANVATKPSGTWNEEVGYGRVNAERLLLTACAADDGCDDCTGCGDECRSPRPVPWLPYDRCQYFYEARVFDVGRLEQGRLELRVTYEHCLRLLGQQQGPLLYTTTLLPGEKVVLYEYDRYRRVRAEEQRLSVHSSFRQTMSALSQTRRFASATAYAQTLVDIRTSVDTSVSAGGGLAGFFGAPTAQGEFSLATETSLASGSSVTAVAEQFTQNAITAAQSTETERSVVVSTFEEAEHQQSTRRVLRNRNRCHAVTYLVRRALEVYEAHSRVLSVEWRVGDGIWRSLGDLTREVESFLKDLGDRIPRPGEEARDQRWITLPTDGTLYEPMLAYCSSCESEQCGDSEQEGRA